MTNFQQGSSITVIVIKRHSGASTSINAWWSHNFLFCFVSSTLSHSQTHKDTEFGFSPTPSPLFELQCILWEPSLRTVLVSWLSGRAPWLPLNCKLLRWENQVGGNLRKRSEQSSVIFLQRKSIFPMCHYRSCRVTKKVRTWF